MKALTSIFALCTLLAIPAASQAQAASPHPKPASSGTSASHASLLKPATLTAKAPADFKVLFTTTAGNFTVEVHRDWAPLGADRFYNLVRHGFFTNASFFRVVPGFVVQFGLNADPAVNQVWQQANIKDDPVTQTNKRGSLVFATAGPNTRTTQLFINFGDNGRLDGMGFAPFGEVIDGMDVVDKIYPGYGEQPNQALITSQGDKYISQSFPKIDKIKIARVIPPAPAPVAAKPAAPKPAAH
jgi:peptidyl-prolyl cis-trans isomerase A (cyclophilin A)